MPQLIYNYTYNNSYTSNLRAVKLTNFDTSTNNFDSTARITKIQVTYNIGATKVQSFFVRAGFRTSSNSGRTTATNIIASVNYASNLTASLSKQLTQTFAARELKVNNPSGSSNKVNFANIPATLGDWSTLHANGYFVIYATNQSNNGSFTNEYLGDYTPNSTYELGGVSNSNTGTLLWGGTITITIEYETAATYSFDLTSVTAINNNENITLTFNFVQQNATSDSTVTITVSSGGNVTVTNNPISTNATSVSATYIPNSYNSNQAYDLQGTFQLGNATAQEFSITSIPFNSSSNPNNSNFIIDNTPSTAQFDYSIANTDDTPSFQYDNNKITVYLTVKQTNYGMRTNSTNTSLTLTTSNSLTKTVSGFTVARKKTVTFAVEIGLNSGEVFNTDNDTLSNVSLTIDNITRIITAFSSASETEPSTDSNIISYPVNVNLAASGYGVGIGTYSMGTKENPTFECAYPAIFSSTINGPYLKLMRCGILSFTINNITDYNETVNLPAQLFPVNSTVIVVSPASKFIRDYNISSISQNGENTEVTIVFHSSHSGNNITVMAHWIAMAM